MAVYRTKESAEMALRICGTVYCAAHVVVRATVNGKTVGWSHQLKSNDSKDVQDLVKLVNANKPA